MKVFEFQTEVWLQSKVVPYSKPLRVCWAACLEDILFMRCKVGFALSLHKSKNSIRKPVLLNIYLIILLVIYWKHYIFCMLIGCKMGSREGSGMNTGCHGLAFCLWEIFEYLPVDIYYHRCAKYILFASGTSKLLCPLFRDKPKSYKVLRHWGQVCICL